MTLSFKPAVFIGAEIFNFLLRLSPFGNSSRISISSILSTHDI
jgi:hypothetical protein